MKYAPAVEKLARKLVLHCQKEIGYSADAHSRQAWTSLVGQAELNLADVRGGLIGADVRVNDMAERLKVSA